LLIYLDTEFCWDKKIHPISIGMVSEDGQELYIELTDTWHPDQCSDFALEQVTPYLGREGALRMTKKESGQTITRWVQQFNGRPIIIYDYSADWDIFCTLTLSAKVSPDKVVDNLYLRLKPNEDDAFFELIDEYFEKNPLRVRHHALDDAHALRYAYNKFFL